MGEEKRRKRSEDESQVSGKRRKREGEGGCVNFNQEENGIRGLVRSRRLGNVYKRQTAKMPLQAMRTYKRDLNCSKSSCST